MSAILDLFAGNDLLLLFAIIGLGYLLGNIRLLGFKLGVAAVLFVGIGLSAIDPRMVLPDQIYIIGLVLFVYAIGLQAGPGFFSSFQKRGLKISLMAVLILSAGAALAGGIGAILGLPATSIAGLYCGALTNTPALAAAVEATRNMASVLPPERLQFYLNSPVVTYGLAYPIGVAGMILWMFAFTKIFRIDFTKEADAVKRESDAEAITSRTFRVSNPAVQGQTVEEFFASIDRPSFVLSRIKKGDLVQVVSPETVLEADDLVVAVGPSKALRTAHLLLGSESNETIAQRRDETAYRWFFVSNPDAVGKTIGELRHQRAYIGIVTRLRRGDVEFVPSPTTVLEMGDRILVVTPRMEVDRIAGYFGDSVKGLSETDYLSLSLGIVLGVFVGMIPIPLPTGTEFKLGFAGGPLVAGLVLGRLGRTGRIHWSLPFNANLALRQIGLVFFLAAIGTKAGVGLAATFESGALGMLAAAALIVSFVAAATILISYRYLKLPMSAAFGLAAGIQTQPAVLAYANQQAQNELVNLWYATVQPASMIAKILLAQIIVTALLLR